MNSEHVFYSDEDVRFEVETHEHTMSLYIHHGDAESRHFLTPEQLEQLVNQIAMALHVRALCPSPEQIREISAEEWKGEDPKS